jgi:hypothetical protein
MEIRHNKIRTSLPPGWSDNTMITLIAPIKSKFAVNIVITKHDVPVTQDVAAFAREQSDQMRQTLAKFDILDSRAVVIKNFKGYQQLHRFQTATHTLQQAQTLLHAGPTMYVITGTAPVEEFDSHISSFREIVDNFDISG